MISSFQVDYIKIDENCIKQECEAQILTENTTSSPLCTSFPLAESTNVKTGTYITVSITLIMDKS